MTTPTGAESIRAIFENWQMILGKCRAKLDAKRAARIKARLSDGFTVDDLLLVPHGVLRSPFHCGHNDRGTIYHEIETIYRDAAQVEKFIALAEENNNAKTDPNDRKFETDQQRRAREAAERTEYFRSVSQILAERDRILQAQDRSDSANGN